VRALQGLAYRGEHRLDRLLAVREVALRQLLLLRERLPRHLQEDLGVAAQRFRCRSVEARAHPHGRKIERLLALLGTRFVRPEFRPRLRQLQFQRVHAAATDQPAHEERDGGQGGEQDDQRGGRGHAIDRREEGAPHPTQWSSSSGACTTPCGCHCRGSSSSDRYPYAATTVVMPAARPAWMSRSASPT
jgi:hypothetical protein